jgi:FkbM family methyltransferase
MKVQKQMESINYEFGGDLFIDVGANVGMWVKELGYLYGRIICIEPSQEAFKLLRSATEYKYGDKTTYINKAGWSESNLRLDLAAGGHDTGNFTVFGEKLIKPENIIKRDTCTTMTIDELLDEVKDEEKDILIKIDTEGADWEILDGARDFIKAHRPTIALENHFHMHYDKEKYYSLISFFHEQNYNIIEFKNTDYLESYNHQRIFGGDRDYTGAEMYDKHYQMIFEPKKFLGER